MNVSLTLAVFITIISLLRFAYLLRSNDKEFSTANPVSWVLWLGLAITAFTSELSTAKSGLLILSYCVGLLAVVLAHLSVREWQWKFRETFSVGVTLILACAWYSAPNRNFAVALFTAAVLVAGIPLSGYLQQKPKPRSRYFGMFLITIIGTAFVWIGLRPTTAEGNAFVLASLIYLAHLLWVCSPPDYFAHPIDD